MILEQSEPVRSETFIKELALPDHADVIEVIVLVEGKLRSIVQDLIRWVGRQRRTKGQTIFSRHQMEEAILQAFSNQRRLADNDGAGIRTMTVHGAKNHEFDLVLVVWPAAIGGDDIQKRRLLYNAIT